MQSYRLLLLDKHGRLLESWVIDGNDDREAIEAAEDEVRRCEYVEVWKGGRPVGIYARPLRRASPLQWLLGSWRNLRSSFDCLQAMEGRAMECGCDAHMLGSIDNQHRMQGRARWKHLMSS